MQNKNRERKDAPAPQGPILREKTKTERQKAESAELVGRHKNSGQKDHKGAR